MESPARSEWSPAEIDLIVHDYFEMLVAEFRGETYNKAERARTLIPLLRNRSRGSIEFKRANISAILNEIGFPFIPGYKPRDNYQHQLAEVVVDRVRADEVLRQRAADDVEKAVSVPALDDILSILTDPPRVRKIGPVRERKCWNYGDDRRTFIPVDYQLRESRNSALGAAGEEFVLNYEQARLLAARQDRLAGNIRHASRLWGDGLGFDILSFDTSGAERLIEVKTTKYGGEAAFYVSANEVAVSQVNPGIYHLYRLYDFRNGPGLYTLKGALSSSCLLKPDSYRATPA